MVTLLSVGMVCATILFGLHMTLKHLEGVLRVPSPQPVKMDPMPFELALWAQNESEPWAREQAHQILMESYQRLGDWGKVQEELLIGANNG